MIQAMRAHPHPVDINLARETWVETLNNATGIFPQSGGRVCVPLVSGGEVIGLITLGTGERRLLLNRGSGPAQMHWRPGGRQSADIKLSQRLGSGERNGGLPTMSAFFVHDHKNTASTLSLMLQNMSRHFQDPAFQEDAVRGLSKVSLTSTI